MLQLNGITQTIQAHALRENWPPSFFDKGSAYGALKEEWGELETTGDLAMDDLLGKLSVNKHAIHAELDAHPEVLAEAIQMVLRKNGVDGNQPVAEGDADVPLDRRIGEIALHSADRQLLRKMRE